MVSIWNILRKAETGPISPEKDFILKRYWPRVEELAKEHDIKYDPDNVVPTDETLIDDVFRAGLDLLLDVGVFCADTNRIMEFEEGEVKEALRDVTSKGTLGEGKDAVTYRHREFEDKRAPVNLGGPTGTPLSEEMAIKIYQSYAMEPMVDLIYMGVPVTIEGVTVKPSSPHELHAELCNIAWARTATRKAGRPGMPLYGCCLPGLPTDMSASSPEYGYRKTDLRCLWLLPQMKVDYQSLIRAIHFMEYGCYGSTAGIGYIGGLSGGPETSMITAVAECLAASILFRPLLNWSTPLNTLYEPWVSESDIMSMWGANLATTAVNKNTGIILSVGCYTYAGPCTEMCLREIAAETIGGTAIGAHAYGPGPNSGLILDHCTGMESRFRGEVARAAAGVKRENANEMVKEINSRYNDIIESREPPLGKSFEECYDTETITPSKEYLDIYERVKKELEELGLEFKV